MQKKETAGPALNVPAQAQQNSRVLKKVLTKKTNSWLWALCRIRSHGK